MPFTQLNIQALPELSFRRDLSASSALWLSVCASIVCKGYRMHLFSFDNQIVIAIICLKNSYPWLNVSCLPDGICPHQVRFG